jgi:hypothetical protein
MWATKICGIVEGNSFVQAACMQSLFCLSRYQYFHLVHGIMSVPGSMKVVEGIRYGESKRVKRKVPDDPGDESKAGLSGMYN